MSPRVAAAVWAVVGLVLIGLGAWCLVRGIEVRSSTGGLLVGPVRVVRLHGGWLLGATAAITAALLAGVAAGGRLRARPARPIVTE